MGVWTSFDGHGWCVGDAASGVRICAEDAGLPAVDGPVEGLFWPIELLLTRSLRLPLNHPRLIDAEVIGQELAEQTGEDAAEWWPAWQAAAVAEGVQGTWFALPESVRQGIDAAAFWREMPRLIVDATARLGAWLPQATAPLAVLDMDAEGVFLGFRHQGAWLGLRRLNGSEAAWASMAAEAGRSLAAMGWCAGEHDAVGRLSPAFVDALGIQSWQGELSAPSDLPGRHAANLALSEALPAAAVNLRHGRWALRRPALSRESWRRSLALAVMLMLVWGMGTAVHLYRLSQQEDRYRQQIVAAFHRGLPHETVMLDALAQLRKAAGSDADDSGTWLRQMQAVAEVYRQHPWQLRELDFQHGRMQMSGTVQELAVLNQIRQALSTRLGRKVVLADTDLQGRSVAFRMSW